jgi:hypothetical protein
MSTSKVEKYSRRTFLGRRYYWRFRHSNGRVMADGAEAYNTRRARDDSLTSVLTLITCWDYDVVDLDE